VTGSRQWAAITCVVWTFPVPTRLNDGPTAWVHAIEGTLRQDPSSQRGLRADHRKPRVELPELAEEAGDRSALGTSSTSRECPSLSTDDRHLTPRFLKPKT
jgi:hypothetical protein